MATLSNNTPSGVAATGLPAFPHRNTIGGELLRLMDLRGRVDQRLNRLLDLLDPEGENLHFDLPKSGLRLVARNDGALLFKGDRT